VVPARLSDLSDCFPRILGLVSGLLTILSVEWGHWRRHAVASLLDRPLDSQYFPNLLVIHYLFWCVPSTFDPLLEILHLHFMLNWHITDPNLDGRESIGNSHNPVVASERDKTERNGFKRGCPRGMSYCLRKFETTVSLLLTTRRRGVSSSW
jgi:hypothetical protein